jgi:hypothetical protein
MELFEWGAGSMYVGRKSVARRLGIAADGWMRILNFICNFISSLVFFSLGLGVYQVWFFSVTGWPDLRRLFAKS